MAKRGGKPHGKVGKPKMPAQMAPKNSKRTVAGITKGSGMTTKQPPKLNGYGG